MIESVEKTDQSEELNPQMVNSRVRKGVVVLTARTIFIQIISFSANALLTVFLLPVEYGVFFLVSAVINFLGYFSDIGFAASLIQKKEKLSDDDLKTIFTAQQILVLGLLVLVVLVTPIIGNFYNFDQTASYLLWALAFSLFLSSLKTIPSVLLERKLEFNKLVIPQIVETVIFNITVVYLAWKGFGVSSFVAAVLFRGLSGLVVTYIVSPWMPSFSFSLKSFKGIMKFGIPYQANAFLAMIKDDGMTLFLGSILGVHGIGLLGWAQKWAYAPLRFFMDQVIKVTFPAFSRLQDNRLELSKAVSKAINFVCLLVFPSLVLLVIIAPSLVQIIPKYNKWEGALFALTILSVTSALAAITTPLTNTLNAIGKISLTFKLMIMWTVLTWIFVPFLSLSFGLNGAAVGFTLVGLSSFLAMYLVSRYVDINYLAVVGKPILASIVIAVVVWVVKNMFAVSLLQVAITLLVGIFVYGLVIVMIDKSIRDLLKTIVKRK